MASKAASSIGGIAGGAIGTALLPGVGTVIGSGLGSLLGGGLSGLGGGSGADPAKNATREQQLQEAEQQALGGNPQAIAELQSWDRPGPSKAEAQQFVQQNLSGIPSQAGSFSGNYSQFDPGGGNGGSATGGTSGSAGTGIAGAAGSGVSGIVNTGLNAVSAIQSAQNFANQQALMHAADAAAQNAYAQKSGIRGQALAGLSNFQQAPDLSADFRSSNPFANQGAMPNTGMPSSMGAGPLYSGNAVAPKADAGMGGPIADSALAPLPPSIANAGAAMGPSNPMATTGASAPGPVASIGGIPGPTAPTANKPPSGLSIAGVLPGLA